MSTSTEASVSIAVPSEGAATPAVIAVLSFDGALAGATLAGRDAALVDLSVENG